MYDEMLQGEFSSQGQARGAPSRRPSLRRRRARPHGMHVAAADAPIHDEFEVQAPPAAAEEAPAEGEGPRGLARYRNAAMVGAGGLACAAVGAFLGGLGGYFTISPAAAHPLASSTTPDQSAAAAANQAAGGAAIGERHGGRADRRVLPSLSGSLTQGAAPLQWLTCAQLAPRRCRPRWPTCRVPGRHGQRIGCRRRRRARRSGLGTASAARPRRPTSGWAASSAA